MRLALDHHYSPAIAVALRDQGFDAVTVAQLGAAAEDDEPLLVLCRSEGRVLLTNNVADFAVILRRWQADGRAHHGVVFTSDSAYPRARAGIGVLVHALVALLTAYPEPDSLVDRALWL